MAMLALNKKWIARRRMRTTAKRAAKFGLMAGLAGLSQYVRAHLLDRREQRISQLRQNRTYKDALQAEHKVNAESRAAAARPGSFSPKGLGQVAVAAGKDWIARRAPSKGAALALYTLFSLAPMLVLVIAVAGFFFGADTVRTALLEQLGGLTGAAGAGAFETIMSGTKESSDGWIAGLISALLVLVSATTAFGELKNSLDELWEVPPNKASGVWGLFKERFLSLGLILVLALMLMASLAVSTAIAAMQNIWGGIGSDWFHFVVQFISSAIGFAIVTALFAVIFKYLPATHIAWKDVLVGAVLTAILFIAGKALIGLYIAHGDISSTYGAAGSVVALITWIYYSAQIFFYGALFTHEYAVRLGSRVPTSGAPDAALPPQDGSHG
jgi:membrane protein